MTLTKKDRTIKYVCYCLLLMLGALLQNTSGLWLELGDAKCFFIIPLAVVLGIDEDERVAGLLGLFAGFLWDMVSSQHMGFGCIFLMLFCYISSSLVSYLLVSFYWIKLVFCIIAELLFVLMYWLLFVLTKGDASATASFGCFYFPSFLYTAVMSVGIVALLQPVVRKLNKEQKFY